MRRTSTASWPTDGQASRQIQGAVARGDLADLSGGIDQAALRGNMRDRDQFGARTDRTFQCGEVELAGVVVADHVDLDPCARLHLQEREIVRQLLGARGEHAVAGVERHRIERHVPGARGAFHERDFVALRADQGGDGVVEIHAAFGGLDHRFDAADGGLSRQVVHHGVEHRTRRQCSARVVEVQDVGDAGGV